MPDHTDELGALLGLIGRRLRAARVAQGLGIEQLARLTATPTSGAT